MLETCVREGARRMLAEALRAEVDTSIASYIGERDEQSRRLVSRNGTHQPREVLTSAVAVESTFATVRHRTKVTKGPGSRAAGLAMAFKLIESAQARSRAVKAPQLVALVRAGARCHGDRLGHLDAVDAHGHRGRSWPPDGSR
jgi:hypothetical protein